MGAFHFGRDDKEGKRKTRSSPDEKRACNSSG